VALEGLATDIAAALVSGRSDVVDKCIVHCSLDLVVRHIFFDWIDGQ